jgi:hypothetical protein
MLKRVGVLCLVGLTALVATATAQTGSARSGSSRIESRTDAAPWLNEELTDVHTGETFTLAEFAGTPILLESFAVWRPVCLAQKIQIHGLHGIRDGFVSISIDTDPNESAALVTQHTRRNALGVPEAWRYAVAPITLTRQLIRVFGPVIASAPSAPIVLICADQSARILRTGVKRSSELADEIARGCAL